jgi:hypothetical protein
MQQHITSQIVKGWQFDHSKLYTVTMLFLLKFENKKNWVCNHKFTKNRIMKFFGNQLFNFYSFVQENFKLR